MNKSMTFCVAMVLTGTVAAQTDGAAICAAIITGGLYEYSGKTESSDSLVEVYDQHCEGNGTTRSKNFGVALDAVVKTIPLSLTGSSKSSEEKISQFCKTYSSKAAGAQKTSTSIQRAVARAYDSFDKCVAGAQAGTGFVRHKLTSRHNVSIEVVPKTGAPVKMGGVHVPEFVKCEGLINGELVEFNKKSGYEISGNPVTFVCHRSLSPGSSTAYEEASIMVLTNIPTGGIYDVVLPEEPILPTQYATEISARLTGLEGRIDRRIEAVNARFDKLDLRTECTPYGAQPMPEPPLCPIGFADTKGRADTNAEGVSDLTKQRGFGKNCRICYRVDQ